MKKQIGKNEKLDKLGEKLIETASLKKEEIEEIVSKPLLFHSIATEINKERLRRRQKSVFGKFADSFQSNWRQIGLSFGILAIVMIIFSALFLIKREDSSESLISERTAVFEELKLNPFPDNPSFPIVSTVETPKLETTKVVSKKELVAETKPKKFAKFSPKRLAAPKRNDSIDREVFYPLNFAGNLEMPDSRQIIRVELNRAALADLGINYPLENEDEKIAADLLVGSDGTPQAYRFANNF